MVHIHKSTYVENWSHKIFARKSIQKDKMHQKIGEGEMLFELQFFNVPNSES